MAQKEEFSIKSEGEESLALSKADLVLHPVRFRILMTLSARHMTPQQIGAELSDVSQASLYRHLSILTEAGILQTVEETTGRGTVEKFLTLPVQAADLTADDMAIVSPEDQMRYFTNFCALLMGKGRAYFERKARGGKAGGNYSLEALYLTDEEFDHLTAVLKGLEALASSNQPAPGRRRRVLFTAVIPDDIEP